MSNHQSPILSFIVPVFNVAPYLRKCVDSLLAQDYDDYEIILVDDGSTDGSGSICDEYAKKPTSDSSLKGRVGDSFASVWGSHTADRTQYELLKTNAIENRKTPTEAESVMWGLLKGNNLGLHFRRQHIILDYIVDFICLDKGLVIELDGGYHNDVQQKEYDENRTAHLQRLGYTELRFTNEELLVDPDAVIARIKAVASKLPSLQGGGRGRPQIRVIHQKNAGLSAARNTGIAAAKGKYICFVDSDDFWQPNVLASLMGQMEREQLDVLRFDYQNVRIKNEGLKELMSEREYEVFEPNKTPRYIDRCTEIVDGQTYLNTRMGYACYAVMFIIRRAILMSNHKSQITNHKCEKDIILFTEGLHFEDVDWLPRMMLNTKRVNSTTLVVYNYLLRKGSITQAQGDDAKIRKHTDDKVTIVENLIRLSKNHTGCLWINQMYSALMIDILVATSGCLYSERESYLKKIANMDVFPLLFSQQSIKYQIKGKIANLSPRLLVNLLHIRYLLKK